MLPGIDIRADTDVTNDSRNFGFINSVLSQTFNDGPTLASTMSVILCAALIIGAALTYVILRQVTSHGRILSADNQGLDILATQLAAIRSLRSQVE